MRAIRIMRHFQGIALASLLVTAGGCASSAVDTAPSLVRAESSIDSARSAGALEYAVSPLESAQDKLSQAHVLVERGEEAAAVRLAHEAELDARLAAAQAQQRKAQEALREIEVSIATLREEIARAEAQQGGRP